MKAKWIGLAILLTIGLFRSLASPPPGYYDSAEGKAGLELRSALHEIIKDHHAIPYSDPIKADTRAALKVLDEDPINTNNVILLYSRRSEPKENWATVWEREHTWPRAYGIDSSGVDNRDLHAIRAADLNVNRSRGNNIYDWSDIYDENYGIAFPEAPLCTKDSDSWEPLDEMKGDIARGLFYMAVRYDEILPFDTNLELTDNTSLITSSTNLMGKLTTLIEWNSLDLVDAAESNRNELIFSLYQTNRNPFVDHPEWVKKAFLPALAISCSSNTACLQWEIGMADLTLKYTTSLTSSWNSVTNMPLVNTNVWYINRPLDQQCEFYRLSN